MLDKKKAPIDIVNAKECWFKIPGQLPEVDN